VLNHLMQGAPVLQAPRRLERSQEKDDGMLKSQRLILTWLTEYPELFSTVSAYIRPEDFTDELYREVASMLYEQLGRNELNPARIMNHFTEPEQQRTVAQIFNTEVPVSTVQEQEKAIADTIRRVMKNAVEQQSVRLDPTDLQGLQALISAKKRLESLSNLHISLQQGQNKK
ncbi:MAG: DNA primase, partial [Lachnospiraceae bacterium]|nr:DNA primase [Lachnospiraceae bacterium]